MKIWRLFEKLSKSVQIVIVLALLALLLVIAFNHAAGENLMSVFFAIAAIVGTGRIPQKQEHTVLAQKEENSIDTLRKPTQDS